MKQWGYVCTLSANIWKLLWANCTENTLSARFFSLPQSSKHLGKRDIFLLPLKIQLDEI